MSSTNNKNSTRRTVATYKWVIDNFSNSNSATSPYFGFPINDGTLFRLFFNPFWSIVYQDYNLGRDSWTSFSIQLSTCNQESPKVKHRMWIVNGKGDKCHIQEGISTFYGAQYLIPRVVLLDTASGMLVNDTLTVVCEIEMVSDGQDVQVKAPSNASFSAISKHYEALLESGKQSDVVLAIGVKEFRVHKLVLSTRSPVFAAMFAHSDMKEAQQGRVEIGDISIEVFELFLRYLYTDKVDGLDRYAKELLAVADMYQMDCLKSRCEHSLFSTLTIENVSDLLIHADLYRAVELKSKCIDYITDNMDKVKATEGWKALSKKNDLLLAVIDQFSIKLNSVTK